MTPEKQKEITLMNAALNSLRPGSEWSYAHDTMYASLEWLDPNTTKPTEEELNAEMARLEALLTVEQGGTKVLSRAVPKVTIIDRLEAANKLNQLNGYFNSHHYERERWYAQDVIRFDDAVVIGMLTAIGADAVAILAPP